MQAAMSGTASGRRSQKFRQEYQEQYPCFRASKTGGGIRPPMQTTLFVGQQDLKITEQTYDITWHLAKKKHKDNELFFLSWSECFQNIDENYSVHVFTVTIPCTKLLNDCGVSGGFLVGRCAWLQKPNILITQKQTVLHVFWKSKPSP